jgi:hypothetical protein
VVEGVEPEPGHVGERVDVACVDEVRGAVQRVLEPGGGFDRSWSEPAHVEHAAVEPGVLVAGREPRGAVGDDERDVVGLAGGEGTDPFALAEPGDPDPLGVDVGVGAEQCVAGERVGGEVVEGRRGDVTLGVAGAALVVDEGGDPMSGVVGGEQPVGLTVGPLGTVGDHHGRVRSGRRGYEERAGEGRHVAVEGDLVLGVRLGAGRGSARAAIVDREPGHLSGCAPHQGQLLSGVRREGVHSRRLKER